MRFYIGLILIFLSFFGMQCATSDEVQDEPENTAAETAQKREYIYGDGNGNRYHLYQKEGRYRLVFSPVRDVFSSSTEYSGGEPFSIDISEEKYLELCSVLESGIKSIDSQQKKRELMTGVIYFKEANAQKMVILKSSSEEKRSIENKLRQMHTKK